jgi:hypothetical protein
MYALEAPLIVHVFATDAEAAVEDADAQMRSRRQQATRRIHHTISPIGGNRHPWTGDPITQYLARTESLLSAAAGNTSGVADPNPFARGWRCG